RFAGVLDAVIILVEVRLAEDRAQALGRPGEEARGGIVGQHHVLGAGVETAGAAENAGGVNAAVRPDRNILHVNRTVHAHLPGAQEIPRRTQFGDVAAGRVGNGGQGGIPGARVEVNRPGPRVVAGDVAGGVN